MIKKYKYIREATAEEIKVMNESIEKNLYNKYYFHFIGSYYSQKLVGENNGHGWKFISILNDNKEVVGIIQISRQEVKTVAKLGFLVYEEFAGKGYGTRAIKEVIELCRNIGIENIVLTTTGKRLMKYYQRYGFKLVGTIKKYKRLPNWKLYDYYFLQLILRKQ